MTDPITDAVRRLKELQEDVERLKAGRDEEGEPRVYISERDRSTATDEQHVRGNDVEAVDVATARDEQHVRGNDVEAVDVATARDEQHVRGNDVEAVDVATARDEQRDLRLQREHEPATWNSAGWNTSGYND